jgi:hypothetical protein
MKKRVSWIEITLIINQMRKMRPKSSQENSMTAFSDSNVTGVIANVYIKHLMASLPQLSMTINILASPMRT